MEKQKTGLHSGLGIGSLVVGIIALLISFIPCLGQFAMFVAPVAIILGLGGYYIAKSTRQNSGLNLGGIIISTIAFYIAWWQFYSINGASNYVNKQMGGRGDDSVGYLHIIIAIIIFGLIWFINYSTNKTNNNPTTPKSNSNENIGDATNTPNKEINDAQQYISNSNNEPIQINLNTQPLVDAGKELSNAVGNTAKQATESGQSFIKKNKVLLIIATLIIGGGIVAYIIFFAPNPKRDGRNAKQALCKCEAQEMQSIIKSKKEFSSTFYSSRYKSRKEAWDRFYEMSDQQKNLTVQECYNNANLKYSEYNAKYVVEPTESTLFNDAYNYSTCKEDFSKEDNDATEEAKKKIMSLKDSEPNLQRIKDDLIGKNYKWYNFEYETDIKSIKITETKKGRTSREYNVDMTLSTPSQNNMFVKTIIKYTEDDYSGWSFSEIRCREAKITYDISVGSWYKVYPLSNTFSFSSNDRYWYQSSNMWSYVKGGWDVGKINVYNSSYHSFQSRETYPIQITFTYTNLKN